MNKLIHYLDSTWLSAIIMAVLLGIGFIMAGIMFAAPDNLILKIITVIDGLFITVNLHAMVIVGIYQIGHGKKISGAIYTVIGVILVASLYLTALAV